MSAEDLPAAALERLSSAPAHYNRVADRLWEKTRDAALSLAGWLHGLRAPEISKLAPESTPMWQEVETILEGRDRLLALDPDDDQLRQHFFGEVLPSLADLRPLALLVVEQLDHLDPDSRYRSWSRVFHRAPGTAPPELPPDPSARNHFASAAEAARFASSVLAPAAQYIGLWHERNVLEDVASHLLDPQRFDHLLGRLQQVAKEPEAWATQLAEDLGGPDVQWEWRHMGRLMSELPERLDEPDAELSLQHIPRAGFVTVICPDEPSCFSALGAIHARYPHARERMRDTLSQRNGKKYGALRTAVEVARPYGSPQVTVRILPRDVAIARYHEGSAMFRDLVTVAAFELQPKGVMSVFAPDARRVEIPLNGTPLDFAERIDSRFVVLAKGARVNKKPVPLTHRLAPGDVIWIELGEAPRPLPGEFPLSEHPDVARAYQQRYGPTIRAEGRQILEERLLLAGIESVPAGAKLDKFVRSAQLDLRPPSKNHPADWWYKQAALLNLRDRGLALSHRLQISHDRLDQLEQELVRRLENRRILDLVGLNDVPEDSYAVWICRDCRPELPGNVTVEITGREGPIQRLTVHSPESPCGKRGRPVAHHGRGLITQHLFVRARDRDGLTIELLSRLRRLEISVSEIHAVRFPSSLAAVRFRIDLTSEARLKEARAALLKIDGVDTVSGPGDEITREERESFPERKSSREVRRLRPAPYQAGPEVRQDEYFYGMENELAELDSELRLVGEAAETLLGSRQVFITGPLKVGKSSLAWAFVREAEQFAKSRLVAVVHRAQRQDRWRDYAERLRRRLLSEARRAFPDDQRKINALARSKTNLQGTISKLVRGLGTRVILGIDEAVHLLFRTQQSKADRIELVEFYEFVRNHPGILVMWIGPELDAASLEGYVWEIIRTAHRIKVQPFDRETIDALLCARKQPLRYSIGVEKHILNEVHRLTGGNPYWVAMLARGMWRKAARRGDSSNIRYTPDHLEQALKKLVVYSMPFSHRYREEWLHKSTLLEGRILRTLCSDDGPGELSTTALMRRLGENQLRQRKRVLRTLSSMRLRGCLSMSGSALGTRRWRMVASILAQHIGYRLRELSEVRG